MLTCLFRLSRQVNFRCSFCKCSKRVVWTHTRCSIRYIFLSFFNSSIDASTSVRITYYMLHFATCLNRPLPTLLFQMWYEVFSKTLINYFSLTPINTRLVKSVSRNFSRTLWLSEACSWLTFMCFLYFSSFLIHFYFYIYNILITTRLWIKFSFWLDKSTLVCLLARLLVL